MNNNKKVKIQSMVPYSVGINIPDFRVNKVFKEEGQIALVEAEALREGLYNNGLRSLFEDGIIYLPDKEDRVEFGFEIPDEPVVKTAYTTKELITLLKDSSIEEFTEVCDNLSGEQLKLLANLAVSNKITDYNKSKILKEKTGKDIIKTISITED